MKKICLVALCVLIAFSFVGCKNTTEEAAEPSAPSLYDPEPEKMEKVMEGTIESVTPADNGTVLLVKAAEQTNSLYEAANVLITNETSVGENGDLYNGDSSVFKIGAGIVVMSQEPANETDPPQIKASWVQVGQ